MLNHKRGVDVLPTLQTRTGASRMRFGLVTAVALLVVVGAFYVVSRQSTSTTRLSIQVERVWSDSVDSPSGNVYYLLYVNASNGGSGFWHFNPLFFAVTSNDSDVYPAATDYAVLPVLGPSVIGSGQHTAGEVALELPSDQRPVGLDYKDSMDGIMVSASDVPDITGTATKFDPSVHYSFNGTSASSAIATWTGITNQTNALAFFGEEPGYRNYSFVFFTGQRIAVTFTFYYYRFPYDPNTIALKAITSDDGYDITDVLAWSGYAGFPGSNVGHPLPAYLTGYGAEASVTLLVTVPAGHPEGVLHFAVQWSS